MSQHHDKDDTLEQEIFEEALEESQVFEQQEEIIEKQQESLEQDESEIVKLKDLLARVQADHDNFKKRTERDKSDMIFFLKLDIFKKILPRLDDLERMIKNTPESMRDGALYEGVVTLQKTLLKDLQTLGVMAFDSIGEKLDPEKHEVMTQIPGEKDIIIDEFERGYLLGEKVLRVAKVVVGSGE